ncbi:MAG: hypothetical protein ACRD0O_03845, partial [Acidimicrobiia bacterium]
MPGHLRVAEEVWTMQKRMILVSVVSLAGLLGLIVPASPAEGAVQEYVETELRAERGPGGTLQTVVLEKVVTAGGKVLSQSMRTSENSRFRPMAESPIACVHDGHRAGFIQHDRREALERGRNDFRHYLFFPYSADNARRSVTTGVVQQQWLICGTGGADSNNGSRTVVSGPGIYFKDANATYKLGHAWREGRTPATYSINLGFEVPTDAVTVKAGITQTPTSVLRGSPRPPFDSDLDAFARNGANGWWEADCAPDCAGTGGSNGYQGSVVEGLWEFSQN